MPIISGGSGGGGGGGAFAKITATVLGSPAANITFSSIPGTYTALLIVWSLRSAVVSETVATTHLRFNGDTGANYNYERDWGQAAGATASGTAADTKLSILAETGPSATANTYGVGYTFFPFYASTSALKTAITNFGMFPSASANTNFFSGDIAGMWNSTSAITSIALLASDLSSNLAAGSSATLYGIT